MKSYKDLPREVVFDYAKAAMERLVEKWVEND